MARAALRKKNKAEVLGGLDRAQGLRNEARPISKQAVPNELSTLAWPGGPKGSRDAKQQIKRRGDSECQQNGLLET
jgi:hypothetical protein